MVTLFRAKREAKKAVRHALGGLGLQISRKRAANRLVQNRNAKVIESLLRGGKPIRLELGAGVRERLPGWTTVDYSGASELLLDLCEPLPFPDNSVAAIYSSHVLEHFTYPHQLSSLLAEAHRILQPGGIFSVAVPNARLFIEAYLNPTNFDLNRYCRYDTGLNYKAKLDYVNCIAFMGGHHKHMFDEENLIMVLRDAGFSNVALREFDPALDLEVRREGTIYAQGEK